MRKTSKNQGFTLIELLVVVAIIGLLLSIISVGLSSQRLKARDARRITDLKQVKSGMDLFYDNGGGYPDSGSWVAGSHLVCSGTDIMQIPLDPSDPVFQYDYEGLGGSLSACGTTVRRNYELTFYMERLTKYYIMNEDGVIREADTGTVVSIDSLL